MSPRPDRDARIRRLAEAAAKRSTEAESRARRALIKLENSGQPVSFTSVARAAAVSTSFLYQHGALRADILRSRPNSTQPPRPAAEVASAESLRTKLRVALERNRELTKGLAVLRTENETLRSRLLDLNRRCSAQKSATAAPPDSGPSAADITPGDGLGRGRVRP